MTRLELDYLGSNPFSATHRVTTDNLFNLPIICQFPYPSNGTNICVYLTGVL